MDSQHFKFRQGECEFLFLQFLYTVLIKLKFTQKSNIVQSNESFKIKWRNEYAQNDFKCFFIVFEFCDYETKSLKVAVKKKFVEVLQIVNNG